MTERHVFISYSHRNSDIMQRVKSSLLSAGLTVWTDEGIEPGTPNWQITIEEAIEGSGCVVCILTPGAKKSRWVREELGYATYHGKLVYMVHAKGSEKEVAMLGFVVTQFVDIREEGLYIPRLAQLVKLIKTNLKLNGEDETVPANTHELPDVVELGYDYELDKTIHALIRLPENEVHQLVVRRGGEYTTTAIFHLNDSFATIGRNHKNTIFINDAAISREHCHLVYTAEGFVVHDTGSTNGTFINAQRVNRQVLSHNDTIQVGPNVSLVYKHSTG